MIDFNKKYNLRVITNLNCNENCYFCYQKNKNNVRLDIDTLKCNIQKFNGYKFPRAAIYGGEATIREDLPDIIKICSENSENISLTTNGTLLTESKLKQYRDAGLKEMGISVPTIKNWNMMRTITWDKFLNIILKAKEIIPNVRINIVENKFNMDKENGRLEFYDMIEFFVRQVGLGVLVCRNFTKKYEDLNLELIGAKKTDIIEHGCSKYKLDDSNIIISYYEPVKTYKDNDYIITPLGVFTDWVIATTKL
jgi:MoaA/NifB/PqqE/SkfB family radical SAM enzyme